ncbi:MAG: hypothetical protein MR270_05130 [Erysipelotrichaceae bacterium]|nr:hypothetical protein [Erysipelotrichaceae bacterium]
MSNQIGLMISLIAMIFMILLSGEVICYQYDVARTQAITNQIAIYIQETGADVSEVKKLPIYNYLTEMSIVKNTDSNNITTYVIKATKQHESISIIYQTMCGDICCITKVCRKENYGGV